MVMLPWHFCQLFYVYFPPLCSLSDGLAAFRAFLRTEFSEENLEFWLACEEYKKVKSQSKMASKAKKIFAEYIAIQSCKEVSEWIWLLQNILIIAFFFTLLTIFLLIITCR